MLKKLPMKDRKQLSDYNFFDPEVLGCPYEFYKLAREQAPVMELSNSENGNRVFLITRYDLVKAILKNAEVFSSNFSALLYGKEAQDRELQEIYSQGWPPVDTLLTADQPEHERFRAVINKALTTARVNQMQDYLERVVHELIDCFLDQGECEFVSSFAVPLTIKAIAKLLGVPEQDLPKFKQWSDSFIALLGRMLSKEQEIECARDVVAFQHYFNNMITKRRKEPADDLIGALVRAEVAGERPLDTRELLSLLQQLLVAGNETLTNALTGGLLLLIQNQKQMKLARKEPDKLENLVEEVLRLETSTAGMWRLVKQDTELEGVAIPAGSLVMIRFDSANRDSEIFPDGEQFDVCRSNAGSHLAFGHGIHFCVGAMLARKEMQIAYQGLLARMDNIRLAEEKNDLKPIPNVLLRGLSHLYIEFDRALNHQ